MKQIILEAPGRFAEREVKRPVPGRRHALIRVEKVGLCGSDFHAYAGRHPIYTYPRVIGHELSGIVMDVETNDKGIQPGDRCAIEPYLTCGQCRTCALGRNNCCEHIRILGIHLDGGMQEYVSVPLELLHKSSELSMDQLALVETLGIGAHAVDRSGLTPGVDVLVFGAGPIGIATAQFASERGGHVHVVERKKWRQAFAEKIGFSSSPTAENLEATIVFDATGSVTAMAASLSHVAPGGKLVFVGLTRDPVCIDDSLFHRKEVTLLASRNSFGLFPRIIRLIKEGGIDTTHWVTDRLKLSDVVSQFKCLPERECLIKAIVDVNGSE